MLLLLHYSRFLLPKVRVKYKQDAQKRIFFAVCSAKVVNEFYFCSI